MTASDLENGAETSDPLFSKFMDTSTPHMHFWPFELSPFRPPSYTLSCFLLICPFWLPLLNYVDQYVERNFLASRGSRRPCDTTNLMNVPATLHLQEKTSE